MNQCPMVVSWGVAPDGERGDEILCGKPAWRKDCCEECFQAMLLCGDFTRAELEEMYPLPVAS